MVVVHPCPSKAWALDTVPVWVFEAVHVLPASARMFSMLTSCTEYLWMDNMLLAGQGTVHILHASSRVSDNSMAQQMACCLGQRCGCLYVFLTWLTCEKSHLKSADQVGLLCVQLKGSRGKAVRMWGKSERLFTGGIGAMCSCLWKLGSKCEEAGK